MVAFFLVLAYYPIIGEIWLCFGVRLFLYFGPVFRVVPFIGWVLGLIILIALIEGVLFDEGESN